MTYLPCDDHSVLRENDSIRFEASDMIFDKKNSESAPRIEEKVSHSKNSEDIQPEINDSSLSNNNRPPLDERPCPFTKLEEMVRHFKSEALRQGNLQKAADLDAELEWLRSPESRQLSPENQIFCNWILGSNSPGEKSNIVNIKNQYKIYSKNGNDKIYENKNSNAEEDPDFVEKSSEYSEGTKPIETAEGKSLKKQVREKMNALRDMRRKVKALPGYESRKDLKEFWNKIGTLRNEYTRLNSYVTHRGDDPELRERFKALGKEYEVINSEFSDRTSPSPPKSASSVYKCYATLRDSPEYESSGFRSIKPVSKAKRSFSPHSNALKKLARSLPRSRKSDWRKIYWDGYNSRSEPVSLHYFYHPSGNVCDVKFRSGWSNQD